MTESLLYINANSDVPFGRVSSTARRGVKWFNKVSIGDLVNLQITESGEVFGQAVIVEKELLPLAVVLENADHNHVAFKGDARTAPSRLYAALKAAYGNDLNASEPFSVLHICPIGQGPWQLPEVEEHVARGSITDEPDFLDLSDDEIADLVDEHDDALLDKLIVDEHDDALLDKLIDAGLDTPGIAAIEAATIIGDVAVAYRVEFESADV